MARMVGGERDGYSQNYVTVTHNIFKNSMQGFVNVPGETSYAYASNE